MQQRANGGRTLLQLDSLFSFYIVEIESRRKKKKIELKAKQQVFRSPVNHNVRFGRKEASRVLSDFFTIFHFAIFVFYRFLVADLMNHSMGNEEDNGKCGLELAISSRKRN